MQTSIEWLIEKLGIKEMYEDSDMPLDNILEQAKEIHKQEIIDAHLLGLIRSLDMEATKQANEYYSETFKKDAKDGLYEDTSHRGNPRPDDVDKFEQDAWDNYEHVEGNLYSTTFRNAFKLGYKKAQETLYTEEQVREAIEMARSRTGYVSYEYTENEIIQSLKQSKKD